MNKGCSALLIVLGVLVVLGLLLMGPYNRLVAENENVKKAWAGVENQLQRRSDLVPNLVNTVKGVAGQEQKVFGQIAEARTRIGSGGSGPSAEKIEASNQLTSALSRLLVIAENYPELKSSRSFENLQFELTGTENRLSHEREKYNRAVEQYNRTAKSFPAVLYTRLLGFKGEQPYFEAPPESRERPNVDFSDTTAPEPVPAGN